MTTIALKDDILAADSQLTIDDVRLTSDDKIAVLNKDTLFAGAGDSVAIIKAQNYFKYDDWEIREKPDIPKEKDDDNPLDAILIFKGQAYIVDRYCTPEPLRHPYYAIGSGWKFAMAGMHQGMSAVAAVEFASDFDVYTNNKIRWINVKEFQETSKAKPRRTKRTTRMEAEEKGS